MFHSKSIQTIYLGSLVVMAVSSLFRNDPASFASFAIFCYSFDYWFLGFLPDQGPLSPVTQLAWVGPDLRRLEVVLNIFFLRMIEVSVLLGTFNSAEMFLYPSQDLSLTMTLSCRSAVSSPVPHGSVFIVIDLISSLTLWNSQGNVATCKVYLSFFVLLSIIFVILEAQRLVYVSVCVISAGALWFFNCM